MHFRTGIGQDSHRFPEDEDGGPLRIGGIDIPFERRLMGNSDADVVLHALCNAISGISGIPVLGPVTDRLCFEEKILDSSVYVQSALQTLGDTKITHISISIECRKPPILPHIDKMRKRIAEIVNLTPSDVGITATSGEGLTDFGRGLGIQAIVIVSAFSLNDH